MEFINQLKFNDNGLIPAIAQDYKTGEVLMFAYMNQESLRLTVETRKVHYFSRSRNKLWLKGETSGNFQYLKDMSYDCDGDALLLKIDQSGVACHTGSRSYSYNNMKIGQGRENAKEHLSKEKNILEELRKAILKKYGLNNSDNNTNEFPESLEPILEELYQTVSDRKNNPVEGSYTNYLLDKGIDKILKKVGEESTEVVIAAKNQSEEEICYETADLFYHLTVLLVERGITFDKIIKKLKERQKK